MSNRTDVIDKTSTPTENTEKEYVGRVGVITSEIVRQAQATFDRYFQKKEPINARIKDNEKWWEMEECTPLNNGDEWSDSSAWLHNSILTTKAALMDAMPQPNVTSRSADDIKTAETLSKVLPVIFELNNYTKVFSSVIDDKLHGGSGIYKLMWDETKSYGMGDIRIDACNVLNITAEPGVSNIQDSKNVFETETVANDTLIAEYPFLADKLTTVADTTRDKYDADNTDAYDNSSTVMHWYYKKRVGNRVVVHYCKYVNDEVLYASENVPEYKERGYYDHGKYPYVVDTFQDKKNSIWGMSAVDVLKSAQDKISKIERGMVASALSTSRPRYFIRSDGSVNEEEFANFNNTFVHTDMNLGTDSLRLVDSNSIDPSAMSMMNSLVDQLRTVLGSTDVAQGIASGGVTAASAINAQQEAASQVFRLWIIGSYNAYKELSEMVIELIRQFYGVEREFRITGESGEPEYINFDNSDLEPRKLSVTNPVTQEDEVIGEKLPIFDVKVIPQRKSSYSREAQNELMLNLYNLQFFNPDNADMSIACLQGMEFEGKDELVKRISKNATLLQQWQEANQLLQQQSMLIAAIGQRNPQLMQDPDFNQLAMIGQQMMEQQGIQQPQGEMLSQQETQGTMEVDPSINLDEGNSDTIAQNARQRYNERTTI